MAEETEYDFAADLAAEFKERGLTDIGDEPEETTQPEPEAQATEPEAVEQPTDADPTRARDERGRFVAQEPERPTWLPEKFKSAEDLAAAYGQLEQRMGQTSAEREELNQLRGIVQHLQAAEQRRSQAPADWQDLIDENPAYAAELAYRNGDERALRAAAQAWDEIAPGAPQLWWENRQMQQRYADLERRMDERFQPVQEETQTREFSRVMSEIASVHPDFDKYAGQIAEVAETTPEVVGILQQGTYDAKKRVVEALYWMARGRASDNLAAAAQGQATAATEQSRAAKMAAGVASASTTPASRGGDAVTRFADAIVEASNSL